MDLARFAGIVGLLLVASGVVLRKAGRRDTLFILGSILLFGYSIAINDMIFAALQLVFASSALYDLLRTRHRAAPTKQVDSTE